MNVHSISIFARKSITPEFDNLMGPVFRIHSGTTSHNPPTITIFFETAQEATNFKNAVVQSWEMFLKKTKEKS